MTWLLDVRDRNGRLTPEIVREEARPKESPGHGWIFGLKVADAAEAFYLEQAHRLIQSVRIRTEPRPQEPPRSVRFFYAVPAKDNTVVYDPLNEVVNDKDKYDRVREAASRRLGDAEQALADLDAIAASASIATNAGQAIVSVREARNLIAKP